MNRKNGGKPWATAAIEAPTRIRTTTRGSRTNGVGGPCRRGRPRRGHLDLVARQVGEQRLEVRPGLGGVHGREPGLELRVVEPSGGEVARELLRGLVPLEVADA